MPPKVPLGVFCLNSLFPSCDLFHLIMLLTKIICWNCKRLSNIDTVNYIKSLIKKHLPCLIFFIEMKVDVGKIHWFSSKFQVGWDWATIPANGLFGGIITLWKGLVGIVAPIARTYREVLLVISLITLKPWILSVIYNGKSTKAQ